MSKRRAFALFWIGILALAAVGADFLFLERAQDPDLSRVLEAPTWSHPFGTDSLGRDLLLRLLIGTKISLTVGVAGSLAAVALGLTLGLFAGWLGGWIDRLFMRATDVFLAVPSFALVAVLTTAVQSLLLGSSESFRVMTALIAGIAFTHWMSVGRVTRALVLRAKILPFIEAARALGATDLHILFRHILPAVRPSVAVLLGLQIPTSILYESFMSFIGVGVQPPDTSWGVLIQEGWTMLASSPHLMLFPTLILAMTVWSLHLIFEHGNSYSSGASVDTLGHKEQTTLSP